MVAVVNRNVNEPATSIKNDDARENFIQTILVALLVAQFAVPITLYKMLDDRVNKVEERIEAKISRLDDKITASTAQLSSEINSNSRGIEYLRGVMDTKAAKFNPKYFGNEIRHFSSV